MKAKSKLHSIKCKNDAVFHDSINEIQETLDLIPNFSLAGFGSLTKELFFGVKCLEF